MTKEQQIRAVESTFEGILKLYREYNAAEIRKVMLGAMLMAYPLTDMPPRELEPIWKLYWERALSLEPVEQKLS